MQNRRKIAEPAGQVNTSDSLVLGTSILEENDLGSSLTQFSPSQKLLPESPKNYRLDRHDRSPKMLDSEEDLRFLQFDDYTHKSYLHQGMNHLESPDESLEILSQALGHKNSVSRMDASDNEDANLATPQSYLSKKEAFAGSPPGYYPVMKVPAVEHQRTKQHLNNFLKRISSTDHAEEVEFSPYSQTISPSKEYAPVKPIKPHVTAQKAQPLPAWLQSLRQKQQSAAVEAKPTSPTKQTPTQPSPKPTSPASKSQSKSKSRKHKNDQNPSQNSARTDKDNRNPKLTTKTGQPASKSPKSSISPVSGRSARSPQSPAAGNTARLAKTKEVKGIEKNIDSRNQTIGGNCEAPKSSRQPVSLTGIQMMQAGLGPQPTTTCAVLTYSSVLDGDAEDDPYMSGQANKKGKKLKHSDSRMVESQITEARIQSSGMTSARRITPMQQENLRRLVQLPATSNSRKPVSLSQVLGSGREENHEKVSHMGASVLAASQAQNNTRLLNSTSASGLNKVTSGGPSLIKKPRGSSNKDSLKLLPRTSSKESQGQVHPRNQHTRDITSESQIGEFTMHLHEAKGSKVMKVAQPTATGTANLTKSKSKSKSKTKQIQRKTSGTKFPANSNLDEEDFLPSFGEALRQKKLVGGPSKLEVLTSTADHSGSQPEEGSSPPHLRLSASSASVKSPIKAPNGFPQVFTLESPSKDSKLRPSASRDEYLLASKPAANGEVRTVKRKNSKIAPLQLMAGGSSDQPKVQPEGNVSRLKCISPPRNTLSRVMEMVSPPKAKERAIGGNTLMSIISKHLQ